MSTWSNCYHADAYRSQISSDGQCHAHYAPFGCSVCSLSNLEKGWGTYVGDPPRSHSAKSPPPPPRSTYLALKGSHTGRVNDNSTLASLVWFILAHLTSNQADHIECAYEIHLEDGRAMM